MFEKHGFHLTCRQPKNCEMLGSVTHVARLVSLHLLHDLERLALAQLSTSHWVLYPLAPLDLLVLERELAMVWEAGQSTRFDRSAARSRWTGMEFKQISHISLLFYLHPSVVHQCCFIAESFDMLFSFCIWLGKKAWHPLDHPWPSTKGPFHITYRPWPFSLHSSAVQFLSASLESVAFE